MSMTRDSTITHTLIWFKLQVQVTAEVFILVRSTDQISVRPKYHGLNV